MRQTPAWSLRFSATTGERRFKGVRVSNSRGCEGLPRPPGIWDDSRQMSLQVLALETYWHEDPADTRSTLAIFDLLEQNCEDIVIHHRFFSAKDDLDWYLNNPWRDGQYNVLYVASHGEAGNLVDGWNELISRPWLQKRLRGSCGDRVLYLSACDSMKGNAADRDRLREATGASTVVGYRKQVDWLEGAAMDLLALAALANARTESWERPPGDALRELVGRQDSLAKSTGFDVT